MFANEPNRRADLQKLNRSIPPLVCALRDGYGAKKSEGTAEHAFRVCTAHSGSDQVRLSNLARKKNNSRFPEAKSKVLPLAEGLPLKTLPKALNSTSKASPFCSTNESIHPAFCGV
jgi:hypothetical protein